MVKRLLNLKKCLKKRRGELKKKQNCFHWGTIIIGDRTLAYSGAKVQSRLYPGDLVTRTGDLDIRIRETPGLSGRVGMYEFVRLLSVSWNSRGDAATSWFHDRRFGLWDIELSVCRVSNSKCVRFVSSIPLKSMQRIKAWKGTLRLRAYNESLLQQIGNSDFWNLPSYF